MTELKTPVAMLVFNRPDKTRRVFEAVAWARPPVLLVVADGPRSDKPGEAEACAKTRAVFDSVDWPCDVRTHYADDNLGCKNRILTGLDWVFEQVDRAIILEDDCLPEPSFFPYCEEMLTRYADDARIHMVRGGNFFYGRKPSPYSYHFSRWFHIWGWATWARAWRYTDHAMSKWPALRDANWLEETLPRPEQAKYIRTLFERAWRGEVTTWEYHFLFGGMANDALSICPSKNLVSNIGFGADAAHYQVDDHVHARMKTWPLRFPLRHPATVSVSVNEAADEREWRQTYSRGPRWWQLQRYLRRYGRCLPNRSAACRRAGKD